MIIKKNCFCIVIKVGGCVKVVLIILLILICCLIMISIELSVDKMIKYENFNDLL